MKFLSGWKEIAEYLHLGVRTAQRWERIGLPVRRVENSRCSPVVALREEIDRWALDKLEGHTYPAFESNRQTRLATRRRTRELVVQLRDLRVEHRRLLGLIRGQLRGQDNLLPDQSLNHPSETGANPLMPAGATAGPSLPAGRPAKAVSI